MVAFADMSLDALTRRENSHVANQSTCSPGQVDRDIGPALTL